MSTEDLPHRASPRWGRFSQPGGCYHVTKCRYRDAPLSLADARVAPILIDSILWHRDRGHAHLLAFVVMPDHVHWLFVLGEERSLDQVLHGFSSVTWRRILGVCASHSPTIWEEEYHDHQLRTEERVWATIEYVHGNPVRKGLCERAEDWPWSTASEQFRSWIEDGYLS